MNHSQRFRFLSFTFPFTTVTNLGNDKSEETERMRDRKVSRFPDRRTQTLQLASIFTKRPIDRPIIRSLTRSV
jgi:hypothetical protein